MNSFLIDECLSPKLAAAAQSHGYAADHVAHLGADATGDWTIAQLALRRDAILVTNNARDFLGIYARFEIHPGLIIILPSVSREPQIALFERTIAFVEQRGELINCVLEITEDANITIRDWPQIKLA